MAACIIFLGVASHLLGADMSISSIGIGSGLDVESIVTQMVDLEKRSIKTLEVKAEFIQSKISTYGQIKSLTDDLNAAVRDLSLDRTWNTVKIASSNTSAVNATMTGVAQAGSYNIDVINLAKSQTSVTGSLAADAKMNASGAMTFTVGGQDIEVAVTANDTLSSVAEKINANSSLSKSVIASVITASDGSQQLMLRARETGVANAFTVNVSPTGQGNLSSLMPLAGVGQAAADAKIKLNGVEIVSSSNTFAQTVPGLSITVSEEGKSALLNLTQDKDAVQASIQKFVDAYNALNEMLSSSTKYDQETDVAGVLQGDSSTVSLQNSLRMMTQTIAGNATGAFSRLSDVGIQMLQGGKLSMDTTKLATAMGSMEDLKSLFAAKADNLGQGGGVAVTFKSFTDSLLAWEGGLNAKTDSLESQLKRNATEQDRVNDRADTLEKRLRSQYSALDVKMASLNSLSSYVEQMVTTWNKSKD